MYIIRQCAQEMVDKTIKTLGYNINIMDNLGIIIGSGDPKRIDTYHEGAEEVLRTGKPLVITSQQAMNLRGVKPGINLPICLNNKIIGVVGITGNPAAISPYGELIKISTEAMLQQAFLTEQLKMRQNAKELYVTDLINNNYNAEDEDEFIARGFVLGYDMKVPRIAIVLKIYNINTYNSEFLAYENLKKREKVLTLLRLVFSNPVHMISYSGSNTFLTFYGLNNSERMFNSHSIKEYTLKSLKELQTRLEKKRLVYNIGIGMYYPGIKGLRASYKGALQAINIKERTKYINSLIYAADESLELLINSLPKDSIEQFKQQFNNNAKLNLAKEIKLLKSLYHFFDYDLNISKAAESLGISRNTLGNRLDKVFEITGCDPRNFSDAVKLKIFLLILNS